MDKETIMQLVDDGVISNEVAARYFPELKENEDEKVKKELIYTINLAYDCGIAITKENRDKYLAWIERQGEQKVEVKYVYTKFRIGDVIVEIKPNGYCQPVTVKHVGKWAYSCESDDGKRSLSFPITSQDEYKLVEQKPTNVCEGCNNVKGCIACVDGSEWAHIEEQEPAWSERDDSNLERAIWYIENPAPMVVKDSMLVFWLKSLKERIQPQPKQEWSEDDERMRQYVVNDLRFVKDLVNAPNYAVIVERFEKEIGWMESLKDCINWKPSDEQIIALRWILNHIPYNKHKEEISGLLDQINELKGE